MIDGTEQLPKFIRLQRRLRLPRYATRGLLDSLWAYTRKHAPQGNVGRFSDAELAEAIDWRGQPAGLIAALTDEGADGRGRWLDRDELHRLVVHDWSQHCEDGVHRHLARAGLRFADGTIPKLSRLEPRERVKAEIAFGLRSPTPTGGPSAPDVRTDGAPHAPDGQAPSTPGASPAPPRLAPPSPAPPAPPDARTREDAEPPPVLPTNPRWSCENPPPGNPDVGIYEAWCPIPNNFVLTKPKARLAIDSGCFDPKLSWRAFRLHYEELAALPSRGWTNRWDLKWAKWCLNHNHFGCPCLAEHAVKVKARERELAAKEQKAGARRGPRPVEPVDPGDGSGIRTFREIASGLSVVKQAGGVSS